MALFFTVRKAQKPPLGSGPLVYSALCATLEAPGSAAKKQIKFGGTRLRGQKANKIGFLPLLHWVFGFLTATNLKRKVKKEERAVRRAPSLRGDQNLRVCHIDRKKGPKIDEGYKKYKNSKNRFGPCWPAV